MGWLWDQLTTDNRKGLGSSNVKSDDQVTTRYDVEMAEELGHLNKNNNPGTYYSVHMRKRYFNMVG